MTNSPTDLSIAEAAARIGVSPRTLRRWIASGHLPARRIGPRFVRIRVADLDAAGTPLGTSAPR